jgi:hypothetical protein
MTPFKAFVYAHIVTGSIGLFTFWIVVLSRKGSQTHRKWGRVFSRALLATGFIAIAISVCTLLDPIGTHQHVTDPDLLSRPDLIRGIFGWMMLYLASLATAATTPKISTGPIWSYSCCCSLPARTAPTKATWSGFR